MSAQGRRAPHEGHHKRARTRKGDLQQAFHRKVRGLRGRTEGLRVKVHESHSWFEAFSCTLEWNDSRVPTHIFYHDGHRVPVTNHFCKADFVIKDTWDIQAARDSASTLGRTWALSTLPSPTSTSFSITWHRASPPRSEAGQGRHHQPPRQCGSRNSCCRVWEAPTHGGPEEGSRVHVTSPDCRVSCLLVQLRALQSLHL